jgi:AraC-like DNA-binding protein
MKKTWFRRLLLSYLPALVLIASLFVLIGTVQLNDLAQREAERSARLYTENVRNTLDMTLRSIEMMMLETIVRNQTLTAFAAMTNDSSFIIELSRLLQSLAATHTWIDSVYVYRAKDGTVVSNQTKLSIDQFADRAFVEANIARGGSTDWSAPRMFRSLDNWNDGGQVLSIAGSVPLHSSGTALLVVNVRAGAISDFFEQYGRSSMNRMTVLDGDGNVLYGEADEGAGSGGETARLLSEYTGWEYVVDLMPGESGSLNAYLRGRYGWMALLALAIGIAWVFYVSRRHYKPIESILSRLRSYNGSGGGSGSAADGAMDEFKYIDSALISIMEMTRQYETRSKENEGYRQLRLFRDIVEGGGIASAAWEEQLARIGVSSLGSAAVSIIEIDGYAEFIRKYSRKDQGLYRYILKQVTDETARVAGLRIWQEWVTNHRLCVIYIDEGNAALAEQGMLTHGEQIRQWMQEQLALTVTVGIGATAHDAAGISSSYDSASRSLDYKSALGGNRLIGHWEVELLLHDDLYIYLQYVRTIAQAFRVGNDGWLDQLRRLFEGLRSLILPREEIAGILTYMNYYFHREMLELPQDYQTLWNRHFRLAWDEQMEELETLDELEAFYIGQLTACADEMRAIREHKGNGAIVKRIRSYVDAHYGNPDLSLALLSDEFDLNPSSISTLFKEEFGEKFVVYVSQVRMEHAKALLRNSEHSIQEIAEKVGYLHQMSFIRAFKKQVGTTPGDYRKVHQ